MLFCVTREEFCHKTKRGSQWRVLLRRRTQTREAELATLHYCGSVDGWQQDFRIIYCCFFKAKLHPYASEMEHILLHIQWARLSLPQSKETTQSPSSCSFLQNHSAQLGALSSTVRPCSFTSLPAECRLGSHWPAYVGCEGLGPACGHTAISCVTSRCSAKSKWIWCSVDIPMLWNRSASTLLASCFSAAGMACPQPGVGPGPTTVPTAAHSPQPLCGHRRHKSSPWPKSAEPPPLSISHCLLPAPSPLAPLSCRLGAVLLKLSWNHKTIPKFLEQFSVEVSQLNTFGSWLWIEIAVMGQGKTNSY